MLRRLSAALAAFVVLGAASPADAWTLTWLGHAGFVIESKSGTRVLVDPWLENPKYPKGYTLPMKIDAILVTHGHFDHAGSASALSAKHKAPIVGCYELTSVLKPKDGPEGIGANVGGTVTVKDLSISLTPAVHSSSISKDNDPPTYTGAPVGFVLKAPGERTLYHAGDTGLTQEFSTIRDAYQPAIALLPIGGHFTLDPKLAALGLDLLGATDVVPMHWGTFPLLKGTPAALKAAASRRVRVHEATPGKPFKL